LEFVKREGKTPPGGNFEVETIDCKKIQTLT